MRITPNWEWHIGHTTWSWNIFLPGVCLMGVLFTLLVAWPFVERWITGDESEHHLLDRPRNVPTRTALGVAAMSCYAMFWLSGANDIIATHFHLSLNSITYFMRGAIFVVPIIAYQITKRICVALQRADRQRLLHGSPSGEIIREPNGAFHEAHVPISDDEAWTLTQQKTYPVLAAGSIDDRGRKVSKKRARWMKWFLGDNVPKVTREELDAARHHAEIGSSRSATQAEITD